MTWNSKCCCGVDDFILNFNVTEQDLVLSMQDGREFIVDMSPFLDNTDDQIITDFSITNNLLSLTLEDGNTATVDLSPYLSILSNTVSGNRIATHNDGNGTIVDINETITNLSVNANILTYTKEDGSQDNIDLSLYLDDTNLARLVSGILNPLTGVATFLRDDSTTFAIDFSALFDNTDAQTLSTTVNGTTGATETISISGGNTVNVVHPGGSAPTTTNVTEVLRTTIDVGSNFNINTSPAPNQVGFLSASLVEIGSVGPNDFTLPAGDYEVYTTLNFDMLSGTPRTNFNVLLREGNTVIKEAFGHNYARNNNGHDQSSQSTTFNFSTTGGTFNIATQREASNGSVDLPSGWIIIKRFEQKTVTDS